MKELNLASVGRITGTTRKILMGMIERGELSCHRVGGRILVAPEEVSRVFPGVTPDAFVKELGTGVAGAGNAIRGDGDVSALRERIAALETEIGYLRKLIAVYEGDLQAAREREANLMMLLTRATAALPAPSKKSSAANQPRDAKGHFQSTKTPKQAQASLIPDERR